MKLINGVAKLIFGDTDGLMQDIKRKAMVKKIKEEVFGIKKPDILQGIKGDGKTS